MKKSVLIILIFYTGFCLAQVIPAEQPTKDNPSKTVKKKSAAKVAIFRMPMVYVQGGSFDMGSNDKQNSMPIHRVTVRSFYMAKYDVTYAQWKAITGNDPSGFKNDDDIPVQYESWYDAQDFIDKLNKKTGKHYRLPTEAEWEYAARGGNKSQSYTYGGSNELYRVAWFLDNSDNRAHSVGQKQPNELGLYDMSGNVTQWCADWYDAGYYANSPTQDPQGPTSGVERVSRGGYFMSPPYICAVGFRDHGPSNDRAYGIGFRLVLDP